MTTTRIPWPVDMRGWEQVGNYADCEIWAKGTLRRLIKKDGPVVFSYELKEERHGMV